MTKQRPNDIPTPEETALSALSRLRDVIASATDEDASQLSAWEKTIKSHGMRKAWIQHPITQEVFTQLLHQVHSINVKLSTDGEMDETTRRGIFREKGAYTWLLTLFSDAKDDSVLDRLANELNDRAEEFERFNTQ